MPHPCPAPGAAADQTHVCVHTRSRRRRQCHGSRGPHSVFSWFSRGGGPARRCARAGAKHSPALPREACGACRRPAGRPRLPRPHWGQRDRPGATQHPTRPRCRQRASRRPRQSDAPLSGKGPVSDLDVAPALPAGRLWVPVRWSRRPLRCPGRSANVQLPGMRFVSCPFQPPPPSARQAEPDPGRPQVAPPAGGGA